MAVGRLIKSQLRLTLDNGNDMETGKMIFKMKSFNNVKTDATADQLYAVALALAGLQTLPLFAVERFDNSEISQN